MAAAEEEVEQEVEAMEAMYGPDCTVFQLFPPHLSVSMKPRTADDLSVQFVEAVLVIKAGDQYPDVPPQLELKDGKGLGDKRHMKLLGDLHAQAVELSGGPMLVAICEAATDLLTNMNVPEGDCCFCMNPLVMDNGAQPFMKLMSCFHCFHSDCFGAWWRWLQRQQQLRAPSVYTVRLDEEDGGEQSLQHTRSLEQRSSASTEELIHCPVCRMVINTEDVEHVRDFLTSEIDFKTFLHDEDRSVPVTILTEAELARRARFILEFEAQQERGGIIENKKLEVIQPGMIVPPRTPPLEETTPEEAPEEGQTSRVINSESCRSSYVSSVESSAQTRGRRHAHGGRTHVHEAAGQDGFRGGRSYRGRLARRPHRGRLGGSIQATRGFPERSGIGKDMGTSEPSRLQLQESTQVERAAVNEVGLHTSDRE